MATQAEVAAHLGLDERSIRNLQKIPGSPSSRGRGGYDADEWRYWYIEYLRSRGNKGGASGPTATPEDDDEETRLLEMEERRLKVKDRAINLRLKEAKLVLFEKTYAEISIIETTLSRTASILRSRHEGLIPKMKIAWPEMPPEALEVLEVELVAAANECADVTPDLSDYLDSAYEGGESWPELVAEDATD